LSILKRFASMWNSWAQIHDQHLRKQIKIPYSFINWRHVVYGGLDGLFYTSGERTRSAFGIGGVSKQGLSSYSGAA